MAKDYHKGVKLQCYIPEELNNLINDNVKKFNMTKTEIVQLALYSFIGPSARDNIDKYFDITH